MDTLESARGIAWSRMRIQVSISNWPLRWTLRDQTSTSPTAQRTKRGYS